MARGTVSFALRTGATVLPGYVVRDGGRYVGRIMEPVTMIHTGDREKDVLYNLQKISWAMGKMVRMFPSQWLWMHNRWRTKPPPGWQPPSADEINQFVES